MAKKINKLIWLNTHHDEITRMMDNTELLDHYVGKLIDCLAEDRIFPPHPRFRKNYEEADIAEAESTLTKIKNSDLSAFKKALIWTGLRISASFVHVFCPPANINIERRFLVNPDKLYELLKGKEQPIRYEMSRYMCSEGRVNLEHFVASCNTHWEMRIPWLGVVIALIGARQAQHGYSFDNIQSR